MRCCASRRRASRRRPSTTSAPIAAAGPASLRRCFPMRRSSCSRPTPTMRRICVPPGSPTSPWRSPPRTARGRCTCRAAGDATGTSLYRENSAHYDAGNLVVRTVATARLDTLVAAQGLAARRAHQDRRPGRRTRRHRRGEDGARPLPGADRRTLARELQQGRAADRRDHPGHRRARVSLRRHLRAAPLAGRRRAAGRFPVREAGPVRGAVRAGGTGRLTTPSHLRRMVSRRYSGSPDRSRQVWC